MVSRPPPADTFITRAYKLLRKDSWQGGLAEALAHPIRGKIILAYARSLSDGGSPPTHEERGKQRPFQRLLPDPTPLRFDRKRLASGEREDD